MKNESKVLACVDRSVYADHVDASHKHAGGTVRRSHYAHC